LETHDLKILAIDDNRDNLATLKAVVRDALPGCALVTALDGPRGVELARSEDPDVILLDFVMPGIDGYAVCRKLKKDELLRDIPVVFLTALRTDRDSRVKALKAGAEAFLSRPLDEQELAAQFRAMAKIKAANRLRRLMKEQLTELVAERTRELEQELAERKRAEEALRESEEKHRRLFETMAQGVVYQRADGTIISANPAAVRILGSSLDQMLGRTSMDPGWRAVREDGSELPGQDHPAMVALRTGKPVDRFVMGVFNPRTNWHSWILVTAIPLFQPGETTPFQVYATFDEITEQRRVEQALRESESRFRTVFEESPVAIWEEDFSGVKSRFEELRRSGVTDFRSYFDRNPDEVAALAARVLVLEVNRRSVELLGADSAAHLARELPLYFTAGSLGVFKEEMIALERGERVFQAEVPVLNTKGERLLLDLTLSVPPEHSHDLSRVIVSFQDITEHKKAEENLRRQTVVTAAIGRVLQGALRAGTDAEVALTCLFEAQELTGSRFGWIGEVNPAGRMDTIALSDPGWDSCRIPGAQTATLKDMEIRGIFGRVLKDGQPLIINDPAAHPDRVGLPSGHPRLTSFLGVPLKRESRTIGMVALGNKPSGYARHDQEAIEALSAAFVAAIQRKRAEAERERLMAAIEQSGEVIIITDPEGAIQYANPAFEKVTGYSRQEALGQNPRFLKSGEQDQAFYRELWQTISSGKSWQGTLVNKRKDGKLYTEDATISPVSDAGGRIVSYVAVKRDISVQRLMEEQLRQSQKMETVGQLAGGVAHDFNNMLQVIISYVEMSLGKVESGQPLHKYLQEIRRAAQRSAELTAQLLAFARRQAVSPRVLDLNEAVASTQKMIQRLIGEDIDLAWMPGHDLWKVKIDPAQLDQILANMAVNARDAIGGVGKLTIETEKVSFDESYCATHAGFVPGEYVLLAVSDDGRGMDKETMGHLFEPFFTTKGLGKGTGLGLATIYGIVKQNNGFINVDSAPGLGSTFKVYLPRVEGVAEVEGAGGEEPAPRGGTETVLVAEDEAAILELARESLEQLGYTVLTARSPEEALRKAEKHAGPIQLLITDVVMPQMNGRQLSERLSAVRSGLKCLYMSGYTADVIAHRGVLEQGVRFIAKPFSLTTLAGKVREVLDS
jgi:PAS domain S-box-containing protein